MLCLVTQSCPTVSNPVKSSPPGSFVRGDSPGKNTGVGCHALLQGDLPKPGIERRPPTFRVDSLLSEPPGKPKNTGLGSPSFLQRIFPTQELNQGLLHCGQILCQLIYGGSPWFSYRLNLLKAKTYWVKTAQSQFSWNIGLALYLIAFYWNNNV